jgi:surfeit locus 1 family protein
VRRYGLPVLCLVVAAVCVRLGVWQMRRLAERRVYNAGLMARLQQVPLDLDGTLPESLSYRHVIARGIYDFEHQLVIVNRSQGGLPGGYIVTPLRLASGRVVLVERGWKYAPDGRSVGSNLVPEPSEATVRGIIVEVPPRPVPLANRPPRDTTGWPKAVQRLDLGSLAFSYAPITAVVRRDSAGPLGPGEFQLIPPPVLDDGPHLSYVIQWFSFALIALVGGGAWWMRRRDAPME